VRKTALVVFEEADYSQHIPLVEILAGKLRDTMIEQGMLMLESLKVEKSYKSWPLHVSRDGKSYMLDRYYAKGSQMVGVQPMDRLMACWAHCISRKTGFRSTLDVIIKGHRKDSEVMLKMQMI
jgi:hypothetical protein